jgi:predicted DNA-binding transcriptional regulator AlpA
MTDKEINSTAIIHPLQLLRLKQVLKLFPVCRSTWLNGVKSGIYPLPIKHGKTIFWKAGDIIALLQKISTEN